jgi:hypothetical protein
MNTDFHGLLLMQANLHARESMLGGLLLNLKFLMRQWGRLRTGLGYPCSSVFICGSLISRVP